LHPAARRFCLPGANSLWWLEQLSERAELLSHVCVCGCGCRLSQRELAESGCCHRAPAGFCNGVCALFAFECRLQQSASPLCGGGSCIAPPPEPIWPRRRPVHYRISPQIKLTSCMFSLKLNSPGWRNLVSEPKGHLSHCSFYQTGVLAKCNKWCLNKFIYGWCNWGKNCFTNFNKHTIQLR
jgi:hypothetical protein